MLSGANNNGCHSANAITAIFIATGQDVANVSESSVALLYTELLEHKDQQIQEEPEEEEEDMEDQEEELDMVRLQDIKELLEDPPQNILAEKAKEVIQVKMEKEEKME